jgi:hypothetical protein
MLTLATEFEKSNYFNESNACSCDGAVTEMEESTFFWPLRSQQDDHNLVICCPHTLVVSASVQSAKNSSAAFLALVPHPALAVTDAASVTSAIMNNGSHTSALRSSIPSGIRRFFFFFAASNTDLAQSSILLRRLLPSAPLTLNLNGSLSSPLVLRFRRICMERSAIVSGMLCLSIPAKSMGQR